MQSINAEPNKGSAAFPTSRAQRLVPRASWMGLQLDNVCQILMRASDLPRSPALLGWHGMGT
eukprot:793672-Pelagomonas_calceolata.AAC.4